MERKKKPIPLTALMENDSLGESSEDSDFRIEDHVDEGSEGDVSFEDDSDVSEEPEDKNYSFFSKKKTTNGTQNIFPPLQSQQSEKIKISKILICCVCLGDESNDDNEIVQCDSCGVTVHEDCYGISDDESVSSCDSASSTIPWFCEACGAGEKNPSCELCPNSGGVFKETDTGKWVHLVCALYIPGVAFTEIDKLCNVTLFEMSYSKWGKRVCSLCPDQHFTQTGVCIGCDAGLCKTYFHVTCAQKEGLLAEAQSEEINHADPFYAHCKLHSDKDVTKLRKRNWLALQLQMTERNKPNAFEDCADSSKSERLKKKLQKYQNKYTESKTKFSKPWIPTQKMARPLISSASTLRSLSRKATLSGINTQALTMMEAHTIALADVHRKWHISPAFNVEYMGYYLDRNSRISSLKQNLNTQIEENLKLILEQEKLQTLYNKTVEDYNKALTSTKNIRSSMETFLEILSRLNLTKKLPKLIESCSNSSKDYQPSSLPCKLSSQGLELGTHEQQNTLSLTLKCATCSLATDQHLLVRCDTCQLLYHLGCLDPPLTRMPKKTRIMGWQCSECDRTSSDSEVEVVSDTPRQLRQTKGSWKNFMWNSGPKVNRENENRHMNILNIKCETTVVSNLGQTGKKQLNKQRKRKQRDSAGSNDSGLQKIKQQCTVMEASKLGFKPIEAKTSLTPPEPLAAENESSYKPNLTSLDILASSKPTQKKSNVSESELACDTCKDTGTKTNIVTCDECQKGFHFLCLDPPLKKSPKVRGYSWHCADCDPSESDSS